MAEPCILFGWPRCATTHLGRTLTLCPDIEWHGEILRQAGDKSELFARWLDDAKRSPARFVVAKILPDQTAGFDSVSAAAVAGCRVAWAGRESWDSCVASMHAGHHRGAWIFPLQTWPPARGVLPAQLTDERGLCSAFDTTFPDAPRSNLRTFDPLAFISSWLGIEIQNEPRQLQFASSANGLQKFCKDASFNLPSAIVTEMIMSRKLQVID